MDEYQQWARPLPLREHIRAGFNQACGCLLRSQPPYCCHRPGINVIAHGETGLIG